MATRPWVTPEDVRQYSENEAVQNRTDARLATDIARAEQYVITYTHNKFTATALPESVKTAVILLAENYGRNAVMSAKNVKSETLDDYSYTAADSVLGVDGLDLAALLDDYVVAQPRNSITMRMRRL